MAAAVADPDPVLYYEHIALYRDPRIKQALADEAPRRYPSGGGAATRGRRSGHHFVRRLRARRRCGWLNGSPQTATRPACSICVR